MKPLTARSALVPVFLGAALCGCGAHARTADQYRDATAQVLAGRNDNLRACYDDAHKADPAAEGSVSVRFKVEAATGRFVDARVVGGTAPESVKRCVVQSIQGAVLAPADGRDGDATFEWTFLRPKTPA